MSKFREYSGEVVRQWVGNLGSEVAFWANWFDTKGGAWPEDYAIRTGPGYEVPEWLEGLSAVEAPRILDVGSGPISLLRGVEAAMPGSSLISLDPLAHAYNSLLTAYELDLPRVTFGVSEYASVFTEGTFDLIYSRNALDHSFDPVRSVYDLLAILNPTGVMQLEHFENEGDYENYEGLHHWNFTAQDGCLIFWNRDYTVNLTEELAQVASINVVAIDATAGDRRSIVAEIRHMSGGVPLHTEPDWPPSARFYVEECIAGITDGALAVLRVN